MARPARFWHSLQLSNPWRLSLSTEADSGEDEIYDDFETSPHLVTPSPGWRKLPDLETPQAFFGKFVGKDGKLKVPEPSVSFKAPELPREGTETDPTPEFSELAVDWHRRLSQAFNSIAEYHKGKKCEVIVAGGGTGFKVDAGKMGFESWERVALPDSERTIFALSDGSEGILCDPVSSSVKVFGQKMISELGLNGVSKRGPPKMFSEEVVGGK